MLASKLIPTRLIFPQERPKIRISSLQKPSRFRFVIILIHFIRLISILIWLNLTKKFNRTEYASQVRCVLEHLGILWIKAAQILSLRGDILSTEVCAELAKIKDISDGIPFKNVRQVLEIRLKVPLESLFEHFEEIPFMATNVAQLHRAYLRQEQVWVAIKVQKPYVKSIVLQDKSLMRRLIWFLELFSIYPNRCWQNLYHQLDEMLSKELDFRYEASSLRQLKKKLHKHNIYVPDTFPKYTGQRVLVMEFIHATLMSDFITLKQNEPTRVAAWLEVNRIEPRRVARCLFFSVYRQIFEDNLFHGDMHPGNVVLLRNSRIAIIDCRSIGSLEVELLTKYRLFLQALIHQKYSTAADLYFLLATRLPVVNIAEVKAALIQIWRIWKTKTHIKEFSYDEKSITYMFDQLNKVVFNYQFAIQWQLSKLARAWANLDASMSHLIPNMNYCKYLQDYFKQANQRISQTEMQQTPARVPRSMIALQELPAQFSEYTLFQQTIIRRQAQMLQGKTATSGYIIAALFSGISLVLLLLEGLFTFAFLHQCVDYPTQKIIGHQLTSIVNFLPALGCGLWIMVLGLVLYFFVMARRMKKHFEQAEVFLPDVQASV